MSEINNILVLAANGMADQVSAALNLSSLSPLISDIVRDVADESRSGQPLDMSQLRLAGCSEAVIARALRLLVAQVIEVSHSSAADTASISSAILGCRRRVSATLPHADVVEVCKTLGMAALVQEAAPLGSLLDVFQGIAAASADILYIHDLNGLVLYVNPSGLALTGYTHEDVRAGLSLFDFVTPRHMDMIEARLESPGAVSRTPYCSEIYTKEGECIPIEISSRMLRRGDDMAAIVGSARDLRLARRLETEINRLGALSHALMSNTPRGVLVLDKSQRVCDANALAAKMLGQDSPAALMGSGVGDLFPGVSLGSMLKEALQMGGEHVRVHSSTPDGKPFGCNVTTVALGADMEDCLLVLLEDLADRQGDTYELLLSERMETLSRLAGGLAHEINNPMTGIMGYVQFLLGSTTDPTTKRYLDKIILESDRCRNIVEGLLSFSRSQTSEKGLLDINMVLSNTLALRDYQLQVDNVHLNMSLATGLPMVRGNAADLQRAFLCIVNNAQQALGDVKEHDKVLCVRTEAEGDSVRILFSDNGPGIPPEIQSRVFDPFFTTKDIGGGTGLGLSMTFGIIKNHDGTVSFEPTPGQGATFTITLPVGR